MKSCCKFAIAGALVLLSFVLAYGNNVNDKAIWGTGLWGDQPPSAFNIGGPDGYGYYFIDSNDSAFNAPQPNFIDISGYGTPIAFTGDDENLGPFLIGFSINYYGIDFLTFRACSNGWASFTASVNSFSNVAIPTAAEPNNLLAPFWDDFDFNHGGSAYYYSNNTDTLIIEWKEVGYHIGSGTATFEIILTANGNILYQYGAITGTADSHTIGIENQSGSIGLQYVFNTSSDETGKAIRFTRTPPDYGAHNVLIVAADTASLYAGELSAYADIDEVSFYSARYGTPTLSYLQDYDAVVVWSNYPFQDPAALGNVLADYLDAGGAVVMHSFSFYNSGYSIQGRLMDDYSPFSQGSSFATRTLGTYDAGHPIMSGASALGDHFAINVTLAHSPVLVASYDDGTPAVAYNPVNHLVAVNGYVGDQNRQFTGDMIRISHDAIIFAIEGPGDILFLNSDNGATYTKTQLEKYWDINGIEYYDASRATPSLSYLQRYDAVLVWSNNHFNDSVLLGNRLADYIDLGGAVVMTQFCFGSGWSMSGRLMDSYSPFAPGAVRYATHTLGVHQPGHFLFNDVSNLSDYFTSAVTMQNGGVSVGSWDDSTPCVAYNPTNHIVAINAYCGAARHYDGDMIPLLHNAINFSRGATGVSDLTEPLPGNFELMQNYPNPFNPTTEISYLLPAKSEVRLDVFNILGQRVVSLPQGLQEAGKHSVIFDASNLSSGTYLYRLEAGKMTNTKKMVVLK
jgi:hypothetical protein